MSLRQKALHGLFWSAIEKWGGKFFALLVFLTLARLLEPEAFGLVALASVFVAFVQVFVDQGFADAIVQRPDLEESHLDTAFWVNIAMGLLMTLLCAAAAGLIAAGLREPALEPVVRVFSLAFIINAISGVQIALFRRKLAFKVLAVRTLIANVIGGVAGITMAFLGYGVWSLVGQQLLMSGTGAIILWTASTWRPTFRFSRRHFVDLFSFGINVIGTNLLNFLNRRSDDLLIGYFLGTTALGYYTVAYRILLTLTDLITGISAQVTFPIFSKMRQDKERMLRAFYLTTQYASYISFPIFMGLAVTAPILIPVVFGPQWAPSIPVMQILAFIGLLHSVTFFNGSVLLAMGKPSWRLMLGILNTATNVAAFLVAVRWGIVAVAAAYVIRGYVTAPLTPWVIRKLIGLSYTRYVRQFMVPFTGTLGMVAVLLAFHLAIGNTVPPVALLIMEISLGAVIYIIAIQWMAPSMFQDARVMAQQLRAREKIVS